MHGYVPRDPVFVSRVLEEPGLARRLAEEGAPYDAIQNYFRSAAEQRALSQHEDAEAAAEPDGAVFVAPWFRGDWAYDRPLVPGVEPLLTSPVLADAARRVFGGAVVRPQIVYANLMLPIPEFDRGHTDVPAFRGIDRTRYPIWLLTVMGRSGLFERWRVRIATAVSWWFEGEGGGFTCWPDGPDAPPRTLPPRPNTALVGDNDFMFHRVERVGPPDVRFRKGLTLRSRLAWRGGDDWAVVDGDRELWRLPWHAIRLSISWKAQVFADESELRTWEDHADDLSLERAVEMLLSDLRARGADVPTPTDPLHDPHFVRTCTDTYQRTPTIYPESAAA